MLNLGLPNRVEQMVKKYKEDEEKRARLEAQYLQHRVLLYYEEGAADYQYREPLIQPAEDSYLDSFSDFYK